MTVTQDEISTAGLPVRERGYTNAPSAGQFWAGLQLEKTPELRYPACLAVYEDMDNQDGQVGSVFSAVVTPILRAGWRVDGGNGARQEVTAHVAADLGLPIVGAGNDVPPVRRRGRFSWTEHIGIAVPDHLQFGHAVFEQVYFPPVPRAEGGDGLLHLRKLGYRPPRTIAAWNVARDGGLTSIQQYAPGYQTPGVGVFAAGGTLGTQLPINRLVVYTYRRKGANWIGRSILRPAYKNWVLKDLFLRVQAQVMQRNGMGIPVYEAASQDQAEIDAGQDIADSTSAGDDSGISLPAGAKFTLAGVTGTLPDLLGAIRYQDEMIARAMLANVLNLGQARGTGSWALGTTLGDILSLEIEAICEGIRDTADQHIIGDLVEANYGPDEIAPRLVFDEIGSKNDSIIQAIAQLVSAGVLQPDEDLETFIRTTLGVPPRGGAPLSAPAPAQEAS